MLRRKSNRSAADLINYSLLEAKHTLGQLDVIDEINYESMVIMTTRQKKKYERNLRIWWSVKRIAIFIAMWLLVKFLLP